MNGEIEKEEKISLPLIIMNLLIWGSLLIAILFIIGVSRVQASNRVRIFNMSNEECANVNGNSATCSNLSKRALITLNFDSTIQQGSRINATFNYTYAQRTLYATRTLWQDLDIYKVYQVDTNANVTEITSYCNIGKSTSVSRTGTGIQDTELRQYFIQGTCDYIATADTISILLEPKNIYESGTSPGNGTSAVAINDFNATSNPDGTEEIINNATNNTINIINNAQNNTTQIMENANANAEAITNAISTQYDYCNDYNIVKNATTINNDIEGQLDSGGNVVPGNNYYITSEYYGVNANKTYQLQYFNYTAYKRYCLYDKNKTVISCNYPSTNTQSITPTQDGYIRFTYINNKNTVLTGQFCTTYLESMTGNGAAAQPDTTTSDNAFEKEEDIFESLEMNFNLETPQIDTTANDLIWDWVHRLLFTNTIIAGCVIALLTFGVIKLILGR